VHFHAWTSALSHNLQSKALVLESLASFLQHAVPSLPSINVAGSGHRWKPGNKVWQTLDERHNEFVRPWYSEAQLPTVPPTSDVVEDDFDLEKLMDISYASEAGDAGGDSISLLLTVRISLYFLRIMLTACLAYTRPTAHNNINLP
jgi:hypothetical protein